MQLSQEQQDFYQSARDRCKMDVDSMNTLIRAEWEHLTAEIQRVQEIIQTLETRKQNIGQIYAAASAMLNMENDLDISPAIQEEAQMEEMSIEEADI